MLFSKIPDTIFRPLASSNRFFYADLLLHLYDKAFDSVGETPRVSDLQNEIGDFIERHIRAGGTLTDDDGIGDSRAALKEAKGQDTRRFYTYNVLRDCGWLIEIKDRYRKLVDLSPEGRLLLRELHRIATGDNRSYGGAVLNVLNNLENALEEPDTRSESLRNAWRFSRDFIQHLRTLSAQMRRIEEKIIQQDGTRNFFRAFFNDYIAKYVITDFNTLHTKNNPFRMRSTILVKAREIEESVVRISRLAQGYVREQRAANEQEAEEVIRRELAEIYHTFDNIDRHLDIIDETNARIERRVHTVIRYMDRDNSGMLDSATRALAALGTADVELERDVPIPPRLLILERPLGLDNLFVSRAPKSTIGKTRYRETPPDPAVVAFEKAKEEFARRMTISPTRIEAFLDRVMEGRDQIDATDIVIDNIDDFVVFQRLREVDLMFDGLLARKYRVDRSHELVANDWVEFSNFKIQRVQAGE